MLNCRIEENVNPVRIICDTNLEIPLNSNIVKTAKEIKTIVAYCNPPKAEIVKTLEKAGVLLLKVPYKDGVDLQTLMQILGKMGIDSVLIEGGGAIHSSAIQNKIVNKVYAYIAPKFIGGKEALTPITGKGISHMKDAIFLKNLEIEKIGQDYLLTGYINKKGEMNI